MQDYLFYQQNPAILIFFTNCNIKNFMLWNWNFQFLKNNFFLVLHSHLLMILSLNIDEINDFLKFWPWMTFFGLHWPFWYLWPWMIFLSKNWPLLIKIKHNWLVSNNQMSKPISKWDQAFWITVVDAAILKSLR